jgi:hypothetical protein
MTPSAEAARFSHRIGGMTALLLALPAAYVGEYYTPSYAVGWFTLALINAGLAQSKRRSGLVWFFLSLFFGPIATFLIVVLGPAAPRA